MPFEVIVIGLLENKLHYTTKYKYHFSNWSFFRLFGKV